MSDVMAETSSELATSTHRDFWLLQSTPRMPDGPLLVTLPVLVAPDAILSWLPTTSAPAASAAMNRIRWSRIAAPPPRR